MIDTATPAPTIASLEVPGARLHYEVRGQGPLVALVGAPMDANCLRTAGRAAGRRTTGC